MLQTCVYYLSFHVLVVFFFAKFQRPAIEHTGRERVKKKIVMIVLELKKNKGQKQKTENKQFEQTCLDHIFAFYLLILFFETPKKREKKSGRKSLGKKMIFCCCCCFFFSFYNLIKKLYFFLFKFAFKCICSYIHTCVVCFYLNVNIDF